MTSRKHKCTSFAKENTMHSVMYAELIRHSSGSIRHSIYKANIQRYKLAQVHRLSEYCDNTSANTPNSEMVM